MKLVGWTCAVALALVSTLPTTRAAPPQTQPADLASARAKFDSAVQAAREALARARAEAERQGKAEARRALDAAMAAGDVRAANAARAELDGFDARGGGTAAATATTPVATATRPSAGEALRRYDRRTARARDEFRRVTEAARRRYVEQLEGAARVALRGRKDLDEANRIQAELDRVRAAAIPERAPVDLLGLLQPEPDTLFGAARLDRGGRLTSTAGARTHVQFPYAPPAEYDYEVEFTAEGAETEVAMVCAVGQRQFAWSMGTFKGASQGFCVSLGGRGTIAGLGKMPKPIGDGRSHVCTVSVRRGGVTAALDGRLVNEWKTDYADLAVPPQFVQPRKDALGLLFRDTRVVVLRAEVRPVTGDGTVLRGARGGAGQTPSSKE